LLIGIYIVESQKVVQLSMSTYSLFTGTTEHNSKFTNPNAYLCKWESTPDKPKIFCRVVLTTKR